MPTLNLRTPEGLTLRTEIAGAASRFGAALVDGALFGLGYLILVLIALFIASVDPLGIGNLLGGFLATGAILCFCLYQLLFHVFALGQTPGKRVFALRVASADGYPPTLGQHVLRTLILPIDVLLPLPMPFGLLGLVVITLTDRRQRLGDLVAGTLVLREREAKKFPEPWPDEKWSTLATRTLPLAPAHAARLTGEDLELLRDLWTREGLSEEERRRVFIAAARHYCERLELGDFQDARVVLKELYLFLREAR